MANITLTDDIKKQVVHFVKLEHALAYLDDNPHIDESTLKIYSDDELDKKGQGSNERLPCFELTRD